MPIYAYRCSTCGRAKDVLQKMSDPVLTDCPFCSAPTFVKQLTAAGFQLKGSGWYVTDFRGDSKAQPKPGDGDAKGDPKGDAKVDAKTGNAKAGDTAAPAPAAGQGEAKGGGASPAPAAAAPSSSPVAPAPGTGGASAGTK